MKISQSAPEIDHKLLCAIKKTGFSKGIRDFFINYLIQKQQTETKINQEKGEQRRL